MITNYANKSESLPIIVILLVCSVSIVIGSKGIAYMVHSSGPTAI